MRKQEGGGVGRQQKVRKEVSGVCVCVWRTCKLPTSVPVTRSWQIIRLLSQNPSPG